MCTDFDIEALKWRVLTIYPFFGSVAAGLAYEATEEIRTAASDGKTVYYNPAYLAALSEGAQTFTLAHELCHIAFGHIRRSRGKNMAVWKAATDAVINQMLLRDGLEPAPGAIDYPEAIGYDAEQFYEILLQGKLEIELIGGNLQGSAGTGEGGVDVEAGTGSKDGDDPFADNGSNNEDPFDDGSGRDDRLTDPDGTHDAEARDPDDNHRLWEETLAQEDEEAMQREEELFRKLAEMQALAEELQKIEQDEGEDGFEDRGMPGNGDGTLELPEDEELNPEDFALMGKTIAQAGNTIRPDKRPVRRIGAAPPIIDWRLLLRDTINYGVDWSFTNAVLEDGIVRPALEEHPMPETEIVLDTSWSVDEDLLRNFLRECKNILQLSKLKAGCFDTVFYGFHDIRTEEDIEEMPFEGGGGTDFNAAAEAFTMRVDNRIIFTDGEADMPDQPLNAIWVVYGDKTIDPEGGTVIHITPEQLEFLQG